jgi:V/A-type H+-transporting ATPase subunit I
VIILGHGINISLGLMAGVIHGLRLNFIEWYHYSFEGGGRFFNPLKLLKLEDD